MGSYPMPRNGILSIDCEFILLFKKLGTPKKPDKKLKDQSKMTKEEWKELPVCFLLFIDRAGTGACPYEFIDRIPSSSLYKAEQILPYLLN